MIQRVNVVSVRVKKRGGRVLLQLQTKCNDDEDKDKDNVEYEDKYMSTTILCAYRWWTWLGARETRRRQTATLPFHLFSFPIPLSTLTKFLFPFPFFPLYVHGLLYFKLWDLQAATGKALWATTTKTNNLGSPDLSRATVTSIGYLWLSLLGSIHG